jgi:hypothetical protein
VLRAGREHAVGLAAHAFRHQIVDQHADVALVAPENDRRFASDGAGRVDAGHQALSGRLFVAGRAVDLSGEKESGDPLGFQGRPQLERIDEIVLDGIPRGA